jgi:hypothetical protein
VNSVVNTDNFGFAKTTWNLVGTHPSDIAHRMVATTTGVGQVGFRHTCSQTTVSVFPSVTRGAESGLEQHVHRDGVRRQQ